MKNAYRINSAKPPKSPGRGLILVVFWLYCNSLGGIGAVFDLMSFMLT